MIPARFSAPTCRWLTAFLPTISFCLLLIGFADAAFGATKILLFSPARIIFTERERTINMHVNNIADTPITYSVTIVTMRKDAQGNFRQVQAETEEERLVKNMIRYSPRRATIEPHKRQIIKVMVQKPANLPPGEYQTRISISPVPADSNKITPQINTPQEKKYTFNIDTLVTSTLPIIIQHGVAAEVTPLSLVVKDLDKGLAAEVKVGRSGNASGFGNIRLYYVPAGKQQAGREIGRMLGLALYLPDKERVVTIPLTGISRKELVDGTIRVVFEPDTGAGAVKRVKEGGETFKDFPVR